MEDRASGTEGAFPCGGGRRVSISGLPRCRRDVIFEVEIPNGKGAKEMNMPGFTAEASLYRNRPYCIGINRFVRTAAGVVPALRQSVVDLLVVAARRLDHNSAPGEPRQATIALIVIRTATSTARLNIPSPTTPQII